MLLGWLHFMFLLYLPSQMNYYFGNYSNLLCRCDPIEKDKWGSTALDYLCLNISPKNPASLLEILVNLTVSKRSKQLSLNRWGDRGCLGWYALKSKSRSSDCKGFSAGDGEVCQGSDYVARKKSLSRLASKKLSNARWKDYTNQIKFVHNRGWLLIRLTFDLWSLYDWTRDHGQFSWTFDPHLLQYYQCKSVCWNPSPNTNETNESSDRWGRFQISFSSDKSTSTLFEDGIVQ